MKHINNIAHDILYNGFIKNQQNHLYIIASNNLAQQRALYKWYIQLHICLQRENQQVCGQCAACQTVLHDNYVNSLVITQAQEKKSIGVDEVAQLPVFFATTAQLEAPRFFCIEHADTLTVQAANSILKFLEEPTGDTIGFLFVKNEQKLLATIRSRGQIIRLLDEIPSELPQKVAVKITDEQLQACALYLLQVGYAEKTVVKYVASFYATIETYCTKLAQGSPYIVAQTELENTAMKTKTGIMLLDLLLYVLGEHLKYGTQLQAAPAHVGPYLSTYGSLIYVNLFHATQLSRQHASIAVILTQYAITMQQQVALAQLLKS